MTGLYIHIPFCQKKCFYCAFIVATEQAHHQDDYAACLIQEMALHKNCSFDSIYFGGGTPSQLSAQHFYFLMSAVRKNFSTARDAEITIEMNPEDVSLEKLNCYQDCGVNRLSLGIQTFQDPYLKFLGRCHDSGQARKAYDLIRGQGFDNVNLDLMYGFPKQSLADIERDLAALQELKSDHVSLYSLTIEEGSKFFVHQVPLPAQETMAGQYGFVREYLIGTGFEHYEVSNFAKPGKRSIHNLNYWQGGNYIGLGVGAHSHLDGKRWWNVSRVREYIERIKSGVSAEEGSETLTQEQRLSEALVFGLRMMDGVDLNVLQDQYGINISEDRHRKIQEFTEKKFLSLENNILRATADGILVLDEISAFLV